jgi:hypothetical protein
MWDPQRLTTLWASKAWYRDKKQKLVINLKMAGDTLGFPLYPSNGRRYFGFSFVIEERQSNDKILGGIPIAFLQRKCQRNKLACTRTHTSYQLSKTSKERTLPSSKILSKYVKSCGNV